MSAPISPLEEAINRAMKVGRYDRLYLYLFNFAGEKEQPYVDAERWTNGNLARFTGTGSTWLEAILSLPGAPWTTVD